MNFRWNTAADRTTFESGSRRASSHLMTKGTSSGYRVSKYESELEGVTAAANAAPRSFFLLATGDS